jgi:hypothetical protein
VIKVFFLTVLILFTLQLQAQPTVTSGSVLNAASYSYPGLPGGSIAQGSMFVLFGSKLGTNAIIGNYPLSNTLGGSTIQVTSGGTTVNAIPIYTTAGQVAAILPSSTPVGAATLTLTNGTQNQRFGGCSDRAQFPSVLSPSIRLAAVPPLFRIMSRLLSYR